MNNNIHHERKVTDKKVGLSEGKVGNKGKNRSVRFAPEPEIREVESYKKYNRDMSNGTGCCALL